MSERISLNRKEFEAFLEENQALVERSEKLVRKIDSLLKENRDLEKESIDVKNRLESMEGDLNVEVRQGDDAIRKARNQIARLMKETENRISQ
jgi:predicted  nucleic acid-binding Zn-ribbon protein